MMIYPAVRRLTILAFTLALGSLIPTPARASREVFQTPNNGANLGVWRITNDPSARDWANYHNTQCWSPDGRYLCSTRSAPRDGRYGDDSMEVHLHDLQCDESRLIERGFFPRWARHRNWLFYVRILPGRGRERQNAVEVRWLDLETGRHTTLATGVENLDETSFDDRYIYGARRFRGQNPEFVTVRIPLQPGAGPEELRQAVGSQLLPNPRHPVFFTHEHGRLIRREYFQPGAGLASRELFDAAGFVTESIRFRPSDGQPIETDHWWFERGVPFRQVSGKDEFLKRGEQWISKATGKSWTR